MPDPTHIPVLLDEVVRSLAPRPGETHIDATAGRGGHAAAVAPHLGTAGTLVLNDVDPTSLDASQARLASAANAPRVIPLRGNFAELPTRLLEQGIQANTVLADLGFASTQMDDPSRGFSFMRDGPLDMRLDPSLPTSAADLVNSLPEAELARLVFELGEEHASRAIARKITSAREAGPILTTVQLAELVREAVGRKGRESAGIHPATRTFQALRIAVNDELGSLDALLAAIRSAAVRVLGKSSQAGPTWLAPGARVAIITFHSLEDRPVKRTFAELAAMGANASRPIAPSDPEIASNPRARSAKLRVLTLPKALD